MHEPGGYTAANDAVLAACAASDGRLLPLARVSPNAEDAVAEARRCLAAGARGFKLHPRSDAFTLPAPGGRAGRRARPRGARAGPLPRGPGHPAPRRGRRRPRAALPRGAAHPRPRGDQRPGLDPAARRRAAEPLLRHRVVVDRRPAAALRPRAAGPDPLRQRHALRRRRPGRVHLPALRRRGRAGRRRRAGDRRRAGRARGRRGRGAARRRARARGPERSGRARSTRSAS